MNRIPREERLEGGIFFTEKQMVETLYSYFDFSEIHHVIDSAAGSCNFLIPLAKKYSRIQFYGIEKHPLIYKETLKKTSIYPNIHYFHGDLLLDSFPIPPCDLYLGNPPFVNFTDLPESYREKTRLLWQQYLDISGGFSLLLGNSRADIAQLVFQITLEKYLKPQGRFGVILPDSLLRGVSSRRGFQQCRGFAPELFGEINQSDAFEGTSRHSFYVIGKKGSEAQFPIPYKSADGQQLHLSSRQGKWIIGEGAEWPREWIGYYRARQGINTLGANKILFFHEKPDIEEDLLYPLLKSGNVKRWVSNPENWVLLPYKEGGLIKEEELSQHYPKAWNYLTGHKEVLKNRKSRFAQKHWYALFGIGPYTFAPYRVTWRALGARSMEAAVVVRGIPNQALHGYIPLEKADEAYYLAGLLNCQLMQKEIHKLSRAGSKSFGQPGSIASLPLPPYKETEPLCREISRFSRELSRHQAPEIEEQLNKSCRVFLELDR